jgi:hypothetical protein
MAADQIENVLHLIEVRFIFVSGGGWGKGSRSIDGKKPLTRIAPVDASHHRLDPTSPTRGKLTSRSDLPRQPIKKIL